MNTRNIVALNRAIELLGGQSALARACGVKQGHVWHWLSKSRKVPGDYVLTIEAATNGAVSRYELRPDIFGKSDSAQHELDSAKKELLFVLNLMLLFGLNTKAEERFEFKKEDMENL